MKESRYNTIKDKIIENKKIVYVIAIIIFIIAVDQIIKQIVINNLYGTSITVINGLLNFTYVENTGIAFGFGDSNLIIWIIVNIVIIISAIIYIVLNKEKIYTHTLISLALIISGGSGNLIDRIFRGYVVDYIDFNPLLKSAIFNFADICVVLGCVILIITLVVKNGRNK